MRIIYTGSDIEDLAAGGVRQLMIGPGVALTDAARERAEELGIVLMTPEDAADNKNLVTAQQSALSVSAQAAVLPARPRGCQHAPQATAGAVSSSQASRPIGGTVVEQLVQAVSALKKQGG